MQAEDEKLSARLAAVLPARLLIVQGTGLVAIFASMTAYASFLYMQFKSYPAASLGGIICL